MNKLMVFLTFLVIFGGFLSDSHAVSAKYQIEDVSVSVVGDSPAEARNLAFVDARRKAFAILLSRLTLDADIINEVSNDEIARMVRSERIFDEKIFANNYSGTFKIEFAKDFVDDLLLRMKASQVATETADELKFLVIPVKILQDKILLWESGNDFRASVQNTITSKKLMNFSTIQSDIDNLAIVNSQNVTKLEARDLEPIFDRYRVDVIYLAFFSYDRTIGKASVLVRGFERMRKFQYRLSFINSENLGNSELVQRVGFKVTNYLVDLKLEEIRAQGIERDMVQIEIPVRNLGQWLAVEKRIERSGFVSKIEIESISRDYVKIAVLCDDSLNVDEGFAKMGLSLSKKSPNVYLLTF
jgi:hypothetical protein